jgi:hypothetical protein
LGVAVLPQFSCWVEILHLSHGAQHGPRPDVYSTVE